MSFYIAIYIKNAFLINIVHLEKVGNAWARLPNFIPIHKTTNNSDHNYWYFSVHCYFLMKLY